VGTPTPGSLARRRLAVLIGLAVVLAIALPGSLTAQTGLPDEEFYLEQNFPNPFTPGVSPTIFTYRLDAETHARLVIYNLLAQEVVVLVDQRQGLGLHRVAWDGNSNDGEPVPAGVYWYKLKANGKTALKRLRVRQPVESSGEATPIAVG